VHARGAQRIHFLQEGEGIEHNPIPDYAAAALTQHSAWDELKNELLALDRDRVSRIMAARIARYDVEALGENVNDLAFTFVAPLRADNHCCLASSQLRAPFADARYRARTTAQIRTQLASGLHSKSKIRGSICETGGVTMNFTGSSLTGAMCVHSMGSVGIGLPHSEPQMVIQELLALGWIIHEDFTL